MLGLSWDNVEHSSHEDNEDVWAFFLILVPMAFLLAIPTSAKLVVRFKHAASRQFTHQTHFSLILFELGYN